MNEIGSRLYHALIAILRKIFPVSRTIRSIKCLTGGIKTPPSELATGSFREQWKYFLSQPVVIYGGHRLFGMYVGTIINT